MRRLPRTIKLPGGFTVEVKQCRLTGAWGHWNYSLEANCGIIKINKKSDLARKWWTLAHEMGHVAEDYEHWVIETIVKPLQIEMGRSAADLREDD
jgi:hypothetical protein